MARPFKPIQEGKPAKELAEYLRGLAKKADVTIYDIASAVPCRHNAISQNMDGRLTGWQPVETLLTGLRAAAARKGHAERVPSDANEEARRLWYEARERASSSKQQTLTSGPPLLEAGSGAPKPPQAFLALTPAEVTAQLIKEVLDQRSGLSNAPDGGSHRRRLLPGPPDTATVHELVARLNDVVTAAGFDLSVLTRRSKDARFPPGHGRVSANEVRDVLALRKPPTASIVREIIAACGGTPADQDDWEMTTQRMLAGGTAAAPPAREIHPHLLPPGGPARPGQSVTPHPPVRKPRLQPPKKSKLRWFPWGKRRSG